MYTYGLDSMACAAAREGHEGPRSLCCQTPDNTEPTPTVIWVTVPRGNGW